MQEQFIQKLKSHLPAEKSLIDEVSGILNINYDAAYRRVNCKTNLSLDETVVLAKHFKISLNKLYEVGSQHTLLAEKSPKITNLEGLEVYFKTGLQNMLPLTKMKSASLIFSAKDVPVFYTLTDSLLSRYKMYVWLKFLDEDGFMSKISFADFINIIPQSLLDAAFALGEAYNCLDITEFWNDNTINGTLHQIFYHYQSGQLSKELALSICEDLKSVIHLVEKRTIEQTVINSQNNAQYKLYKSDLLTMSNTLMIKTQHQKVFFTPFTVLTYFKIQHPPTCDEMERFFTKQMLNSKLLVNAGEKDRSLFFNMMGQKIDTIIQRININQDLIFF